MILLTLNPNVFYIEPTYIAVLESISLVTLFSVGRFDTSPQDLRKQHIEIFGIDPKVAPVCNTHACV